MDAHFSGLIVTAAIAVVASAAISVSVTRTFAQAPAVSSAALKAPQVKTAWGEPDLQGIWTDEVETPLQRPAKYANQEFFTEAQRTELDRVRSDIVNRRATERDANNGYNGAVFFSTKRTGARTSKIVDPPQWPASPFDAGRSEGGGGRPGISPRHGAIHQYVQEPTARLCRLEI
jgi:hypothetical protein